MPSEQVWYRFEGKRKDGSGSVLKLRIQDLPQDRTKDALELISNYFITEESVNRAVGMVNNPIALEARRQFYKANMPTYQMIICCSDDSDDVQEIMGLSVMSLSTDLTSWIEKIKSAENEIPMTKEEKKYFDITYEYNMKYNPVKEFNLDSYCIDKCVVVAPRYRRLGIAEMFFKVRRIMCATYGVPMTGGWMTGIGSQIAAARDGWETVCEIEYDYLAKKYDVTFTDVPPTMKFMLTKVKTLN